MIKHLTGIIGGISPTPPPPPPELWEYSCIVSTWRLTTNNVPRTKCADLRGVREGSKARCAALRGVREGSKARCAELRGGVREGSKVREGERDA